MAWLKDAERGRDTESLGVIQIVLYVDKCSTNCPKLSNEKGDRGRQLYLSPGFRFYLLLRSGILSVEEVALVGSSKKKAKGGRIGRYYQSPAPPS